MRLKAAAAIMWRWRWSKGGGDKDEDEGNMLFIQRVKPQQARLGGGPSGLPLGLMGKKAAVGDIFTGVTLQKPGGSAHGGGEGRSGDGGEMRSGEVVAGAGAREGEVGGTNQPCVSEPPKVQGGGTCCRPCEAD